MQLFRHSATYFVFRSTSPSKTTLTPSSSFGSSTPRSASPINFEDINNEAGQELEQDRLNEIVEMVGGKLLVMAGTAQQLVNRLAGAKTIGK